MVDNIKLYLLSAVVFFALDFAWITFGANPLYQRYIPHLLAEKPNLFVALAFYLLYLAVVLWLIVLPALAAGDIKQAVLFGALLGFAAYGTYDLTNWSIMKDWPWFLSIADWAWGTFLTTVTAAAAYYIGTWLGMGAK
jgi:uncharacterized membrane protein